MRIRNMAQCALFAALLALCAWIWVPVFDVAVTMQTFGVFLTLNLLGGKRGTVAILIYLLLGAVGLPVFAGFQGGLGTLLGMTGGYIAGFLVTGLFYWMFTAIIGDSPKSRLIAMVLGLLLCYGFGTLWFRFGYLQSGSTVGLLLMKCVVPYLIPDGLKLMLAWTLSRKVKPYVYCI